MMIWSQIINMRHILLLIDDVKKMAYPEPVPVLKAKDFAQFERRLENFSLTPEQKEFYREAFKRFGNGSE